MAWIRSHGLRSARHDFLDAGPTYLFLLSRDLDPGGSLQAIEAARACTLVDSERGCEAMIVDLLTIFFIVAGCGLLWLNVRSAKSRVIITPFEPETKDDLQTRQEDATHPSSSTCSRAG